jgi:hypothetical protein
MTDTRGPVLTKGIQRFMPLHIGRGRSGNKARLRIVATEKAFSMRKRKAPARGGGFGH